MIWFTADLHINHSKILEYDNRPFKDVDEMARVIIARWNNRVKKTDIVYILGDIAFGPIAKWAPIINQLQGGKLLIRGNHDENNNITASRHIVNGIPIFKDIRDIEHLTLGGIPLVLCHYPYESECDEGRFMELRPRDTGRLLIHGHTHKGPIVRGRMFNAGIMLHDYTPVSWNEVQKLIKDI